MPIGFKPFLQSEENAVDTIPKKGKKRSVEILEYADPMLTNTYV
jgi:hypothetical protein